MIQEFPTPSRLSSFVSWGTVTTGDSSYSHTSGDGGISDGCATVELSEKGGGGRGLRLSGDLCVTPPPQ